MSFNLVTDAWIPVQRQDGARALIAPWQMADETLTFPDWPRADLNIACLELLIGLVFLADPPRDVEDWQARQAPDPDRLRERLAPFAPAFDLLGDGPRFMQDLEPLEVGVNHPNPPDMLFIDSAGGQTISNNADLSVKRERYCALDLPLVAMALYTLQAHAPPGGKGNRTSMRGGGPLLTLVEPDGGLWRLVWANVPYGAQATVADLPWMKQARTSEQNQQVFPQDAHPIEALFGMPRRLRLVADAGGVVGVVQKPYGANYAGWEHPLTPHYRPKAGAELLPRHPRAGTFGYRNWIGVIAKRASSDDDTARRATVLGLWNERAGGRHADVIVAGWAMDNMKPRDFLFSRAPLIDLHDEVAERMEGLVEAADKIAVALRGSLTAVLGEGEAREAAREDFCVRTQSVFEKRLQELQAEASDGEAVARGWLRDLRSEALAIFEALALPGLSERDVKDQAEIVQARSNLAATCAGYRKLGREVFLALKLPIP